ncbi:allantoate amidohydrolase [Deinococcus radiodurans]|jgi:amidase, hydantoinase/carbamoylase family|uniref:N-carbamyl-L-amino acid amidohydrolase n=1 Tax=Deinococcus radiodurans (strain ATCC 13939 / DSM 20539 / JCM 16871 / CCUG 27074 / LMG 4051 / NBRC 15346 / NCIMB 9279 / VKM B-1422 / R1) TaxID=243230 RepID=Q9RV75_DEIRA|nr:allantoate amidohydrolase [Deinococcus radiodurans]AAF10728.1 N-carbamyl-L-amino acid amidohydrolase [Deinococcus radiodurans R1 = ATCC 13939 = DSM 20539]ANC71672.1 Zn-dependent hydrolase [Deinococcus radiodurans R1 = ATCC 13939 = DSM 20539]QEM70637.1 allantoate amidohydrolase [Deinococcus radiodurans]QIP29237.1 allantoate amidohydrolase [Deinococcus radiodurans]QIP32070.1 allantoate amidohydrolase [Deinococcus radiodurans]
MNETQAAQLTRQVLDTCDALACHTEVPGEITRTYLCPTTRQVHEELRAWADRLGMTTRVDAVGNLRSRLESRAPGARTLYIGSHLDTVPNAGRYDGIIGVVFGYALVEALRERELPFHLEVLGFSEEEGVRYGVSFIGSRALVGTADELLTVSDRENQTVRDAIVGYGLNPDELPGAGAEDRPLGYLEIHIEQGPVLQDQGAAVGVVSAIVGQSRLTLHFTGRASHAGTTPMHLRRDALAAAARFIVGAEDLANRTPGLVATVGMIEAKPGAGNVIAGEVSCSLDIRHADDAVRAQSLQELLALAEREAAARQVACSVTPRMAEAAVPMAPSLRALLHQAAEEQGLTHPELVSGAGHDAQIMAQKMPAAMLFLRSPNALSHHPDEMAEPGDVAAGLRVGTRFLELLAAQAEQQVQA